MGKTIIGSKRLSVAFKLAFAEVEGFQFIGFMFFIFQYKNKSKEWQ